MPADRHAFARIVFCGDFVEVYKYSSPIPVGFTRSHNIVKGDGGDKRLDNLMRSRQKIRRIIWSNECKYTKFVTFTYANTVLDTKQVRRDVTTFVQSMRRSGYDMKYLYVLENQKSRDLKEGNAGSLHVHMVLFIEEKIPFETLNKCWKHGFVDIGAGRKIRNLGAYVCKYLTKDNLLDFGSHAFACSIGLNRGNEEVFYIEGFSSNAIGIHPDDVMAELDIHYVNQTQVSFLTKDYTDFVQTIDYYQGKINKESMFNYLGSENFELVNEGCGELVAYFNEEMV